MLPHLSSSSSSYAVLLLIFILLITGKRTLHNPFLGKDQPWDPYGVSKLDMSGLLLGQKVMHLKIPIHQCDIPDILGIHENWQDDRLIGISGAVDGPGK